ncbi:DUF4893 domain-containing protein [Brevundimonas sp. PAMC22021]|uniref:DUF4893 domain-containing protein n=1 Tax=Brevundimonas sp. PAMC22021 TaxID=2861285 RepID=UPI002104C472|nr:DUF4893 domain-containing protein [Brevundimonas sp. PAMC22021]
MAPTPALSGWRAQASAADRGRHDRLAEAWTRALEQSRRLPGSGDLTRLGELIAQDAARPGVSPPPGAYRCRTVKLGSQSDVEGEEAGLGYVVYGWFACRIEQSSDGLRFTKLTGSQRPSGRLFADDDQRMVMLGAMALGGETTTLPYGQSADRDVLAVLERIGERRWRLVTPWPQAESTLDLIELVPAT